LILLIIGIIKRHKFTINNTNKILIYIFFISLLLLPLDIVEYLLRKKIFPSPTYIPQGIFIFAIYILIINYINLLFNINLLYKSKFNNINIDYEDAPEKFISNFSLTEREKEIIEYLVKGYNHKDISKYLHISQRTVERHVYNIYKKCEINTKIDLVNLIREYQ
jgi:DNA-binding CsgD family transcriptional regulator